MISVSERDEIKFVVTAGEVASQTSRELFSLDNLLDFL